LHLLPNSTKERYQNQTEDLCWDVEPCPWYRFANFKNHRTLIFRVK